MAYKNIYRERMFRLLRKLPLRAYFRPVSLARGVGKYWVSSKFGST